MVSDDDNKQIVNTSDIGSIDNNSVKHNDLNNNDTKEDSNDQTVNTNEEVKDTKEVEEEINEEVKETNDTEKNTKEVEEEINEEVEDTKDTVEAPIEEAKAKSNNAESNTKEEVEETNETSEVPIEIQDDEKELNDTEENTNKEAEAPIDETNDTQENTKEGTEAPIEESNDVEENAKEEIEAPIEETNEETNEETEAQNVETNTTNEPPNDANPTPNYNSALSLVKETLNSLLEHKDIKKSPQTEKIIQRVFDKYKALAASNSNSINSIELFDALRSACQTNSIKLQRKALDCLANLFSFRALDETVIVNDAEKSTNSESNHKSSSQKKKQRLIDASIDVISNCFQGESTDTKIELQIVRALSSCILVEDVNSLCHGASLLKAIRTIYNIFIYSLSSSNQGIAQASLIQIVNAIFSKIDIKAMNQNQTEQSNASVVNSDDLSDAEVDVETNNDNISTAPLTLKNMEKLNIDRERLVDAQEDSNNESNSQELAMKDAFFVFRAMVKISTKSLEPNLDMRSHAIRSKMLALHLIHSMLKDHIEIFLSNLTFTISKEATTLVDAIREYLCLALTRNAASPISPVFEITLEIMWLLVSHLRVAFRKEIPVFLTEIYFPISDLTTSTPHQKRYFLYVIQRLCNDPRALIEFYLNYDCNANMPNVMEMMVDYLTKLALTRVEVTSTQKASYQESLSKSLATYDLSQLPLLSISNLSSSSDPQVIPSFPIDFALKMTSLTCIVSILRSLSSWSHKALHPVATMVNNRLKRPELSESTSATSNRKQSQSNISLNDDTISTLNQSRDIDDPHQFDNLKQRKTDLSYCIRIFNNKPRKAIPELIAKGFLTDDKPASIAKWLLDTEGLNLSTVGDYLGEGDEKNIAIMHAFVDQFDFSGLTIVDGLRDFLQSFRLPGEGQKIDRFMLKFAERFCDQNPGVFSKADTAYVLSYSIIMLNTDLHSSQVRNRMTLEEFIENNEGIDNGNDLPKEFMVGIFNEISENEIKLLSEQHEAMLANDESLVQTQSQSAFNFFSSRDMVREAYMQVSQEISNKTENVFKNLNKGRKSGKPDVFYGASHVEHVKSIFETLWMSFLAALTPPFKEYDDDETTSKCLEGLRISIKISTIFGIDDARKSFIGAVVQFASLQNVEEVKIKNVNAILVLLEEALAEGTFFKDSWKDVLFVVSQVERLQLISKGIDRNAVPDVAQARVANHRNSIDSTKTVSTSYFDIWSKKMSPTELAQEKHNNQKLSPEISTFISSSELVVLMDNIFTKSADLSANAIVDFITGMTQVALEEIESSQSASTPRMFSLQKMVDVCYYNMNRIKVEWTPIWAVMGEAFNKIATISNLAVVFFAIDSLRQLSMRFLDIEELSGFEFKCDFLQPFRYIIQNTINNDVQEMILECFRNFILTKANKIQSGWKPILESLQFAARSRSEAIVTKTFRLTSEIVAKYLRNVFAQEDAFGELTETLKEISKNKKFQKLSLHSLEALRNITKEVAKICYSDDEESVAQREAILHGKDIFQDIWFPLLFCFNETIMTAEDLEVRSKALSYMFDSLVTYGDNFSEEFWENICTKLLFPIFGVLSKHWEINQFNSHDDLSVWLSTTLIQALRNLIALFTHYFESLNKMLDGFLGLLVSCICQENDTIARIGRACLQQLILENLKKFNDTHWDEVGVVFERLFELTTASELFDYDPLQKGRQISTSRSIVDIDEDKSDNGDKSIDETVKRAHEEETSQDVGHDMNTTQNQDSISQSSVKTPKKVAIIPANKKEELRRRNNVKNSIVVKCVLQLLMIELSSELFENEEFLTNIPHKQALRITGLLEKSYEFARDFNEDYDLRTRLVSARVVDKIPNLLKQETSAAAVLIDILFKLYLNDEEKKPDLAKRLVNICLCVVKGYISLDDRTMERSINTWRPVIVEILQGYYEFDDEDFKEYCPLMYKLVMNILDKTVPSELRHSIKLFLARVGDTYLANID